MTCAVADKTIDSKTCFTIVHVSACRAVLGVEYVHNYKRVARKWSATCPSQCACSLLPAHLVDGPWPTQSVELVRARRSRESSRRKVLQSRRPVRRALPVLCPSYVSCVPLAMGCKISVATSRRAIGEPVVKTEAVCVVVLVRMESQNNLTKTYGTHWNIIDKHGKQ